MGCGRCVPCNRHSRQQPQAVAPHDLQPPLTPCSMPTIRMHFAPTTTMHSAQRSGALELHLTCFHTFSHVPGAAREERLGMCATCFYTRSHLSTPSFPSPGGSEEELYMRLALSAT